MSDCTRIVRFLVCVSVIALAPSLATSAIAETRRLRVDLKWEHQPRESGVNALQTAAVPGGLITYRRVGEFATYSIELIEDGHAECMTGGTRKSRFWMLCGTGSNWYYQLDYYPGIGAVVERVWTSVEPKGGTRG